jgi:predicted PurR-regulated permease PerM
MVFRQYHSPVNLSTRERQLITTLVVLLIILATFQILADLTDVLSRVADVLIIFVAAWAVSYLLSPLVTRIDQRTILNRALSVVVVYIGIAFVLAGTLALAVPGLVGQLNDLIVRAPEYGDRAAREVVALQQRLEGAGVPVNVTDLYGQVPAKLSQIAGSVAGDALGFVSGTANVLFNFTLVLIIAFIMLIDGDQLWRRFIGALSPELRSEAELLRQSADRSFGGFIRGSLILGLIYGVATLAILVPLGVPFAGVLAVLSGLTMIIPFFGPIIAEIPVLAVTLLGAPDVFIWVLVLTIALQQVVLNVIGPRIMSNAIGIHPIFVFLALLLGSRIAGFWGVLLAMPVAGIFNTFVRYAFQVAQGRRGRTEAASLIEESDAAAAAAAADMRDAEAETREALRLAREARYGARGK